MAEIVWRKYAMHIFDTLILNEDRRPENWLLDDESWMLCLIDDSRSFRVDTELAEGFTEQPIHPTAELCQALQRLDEARLKDLLESLMMPAQIGAILERGGLTVEKIDRDLEHYGDRAIFALS